jgi:hypothetical protein
MSLDWIPAIGDKLGSAALTYATNGWAVFPCNGKAPLTNRGFKDATAGLEQVEIWWKRWPNANIGWALPANLFVLDEDFRHGGHLARRHLEGQHQLLPVTLRQSSGGGGYHWIFSKPGPLEVRQGAGLLGTGLDTRVGGRGYLVVAPSVHPRTGRRYRWDTVHVPVLAPQWLRDLACARPAAPATLSNTRPSSTPTKRAQRWARAALRNLAREVAGAVEGTRNSTLNRAAYRVGQLVGGGLLDEAEARAVLRAVGLASGLPEREVDRVLR